MRYFGGLLDKPTGYLIVSVVYHLLYTLCALDVYFRSPIQDVGGLRPFNSKAAPLAKRLVFITLDGAPADAVFKGMVRDMVAERDGGGSKGNTMEFMGQVMERGDSCWGVTHTHVPTESRPGHVALIAGLYEDPSAVTTGWQTNPNMSFDTVWKEASYVWQWGAPEIVNIFADSPHVETRASPSEINDFSQLPANLDSWVTANMSNFFSTAVSNATRLAQLNSNRVVLFFHLLGMDSAGHRYGTEGEGYLETLIHADQCVKTITDTVSAFYGDDRTVFVVTADHGMTKRGSHGDGSPEETRVPLVIYGAGVNKQCKMPNQDPSFEPVKYWQEAFSTVEEEYRYTEEEWQRDPRTRLDVEPADVAMLLASLMSSPLPVHSEGVTPVEYLDNDPVVRAHAWYTNVQQAAERVRGAAVLREGRSYFFSPWPGQQSADAALREMESALSENNYEHVMTHGETLIRRFHEGSSYYRTYDHMLMISAVGFAYITWGLYSMTMVSGNEVVLNARAITLLVASYAVVVPAVYAQGMTVRDSFYLLAPFHLMPCIVQNWSSVRKVLQGGSLMGFCCALLCVAAVALGFHHREAFTMPLAVVGMYMLLQKRYLVGVLSLCCGIFTLLPCVGSDFLFIVAPTGILQGICGLMYCKYKERQSLVAPIVLILLASCIVAYSDYIRHTSNDGLPLVNQLSAWCVLLVSLYLPQTYNGKDRLLFGLLCLQPPMVLLSVGYEPLFFMCLAGLLVTVESNTRSSDGVDMASCSVFLMFLVYFGFFATGNIASISSFDLPSVYRLQTHFDKAIMGALLIFKLWLPLIAILCTVLTMSTSSRGFFSVFSLSVALSDTVTFFFFTTLRNTGSWKQIGHSISCFVITNLLTIILTLLWGLAKVYLGHRETPKTE
eukprot:TRINITY_DN883_c4_g1_i1.p1 TRINITY_DN883_c4_g1~~TRINITY_DN883_c4_g1_i1.p1  ORF type:complete len:917 (+),score=203.83 TRINITY_DN883_c4_g1_i1:74-2752(+)